MNILITSGGTRVPIDPVRYIGNISKGTFGAALADVALSREHEVTLLRHKEARKPKGWVAPYEYTEHLYDTYGDYVKELGVLLHTHNYDVVLLAAAVSDYGVKPADDKIETSHQLTLNLYPLKKVINLVKQIQPGTFLVGFKLLTNATYEQMIKAARKQMNTAGSDLVWCNSFENLDSGLIVTKDGATPVDGDSKTRAKALWDAIECTTYSSLPPAL